MPESVQDVETIYGKIRGCRHDGFSLFRGVPYARPPVGSLLPAPQRPEGWSGVRDATSFGPPAAQNPDPLDRIWGEVLAPGDEDCLTLNVWTPAADDGKRPVMVCIHGGAFLIGSGRWPWYDGREFILRGDIVLITINYRLGAFGFLDLSENGGAEFAECGNHGLLDQVAALRWVRDNIERFGGDPGSVTVFGESAGGISISCLMAMPAARGLFRRAIVMSGGPNLVRFPATAQAVARAFLRTAGVRDAGGLLTLSTPALLKAQKRFLRSNEFGGDLVFGPVVDGSVLPDPPLHAIRAGCARDVALLTGTTRDEARLWSIYVPILRWTHPHALKRVLRHTVGNRWREVVAAYQHSRPGQKAGNLTIAINGDLLFRMPAIRLAEAQSAHRPEDTRMYLFAWKTPVLGGRLGRHTQWRSHLSSAICTPQACISTRAIPRIGEALSNLVQDAWIAFAKSGDPNHSRLPAWPAYRADSRATVVFDETTLVEDDPMAEERSIWANVPFDGLNPAIEYSVPFTWEIRNGRVKAIKAYLGYLHHGPESPGYVPYYELAATYYLPFIFHTGDTYSTTAKVKFAHPLLVDEVAVDHRGVNFVMAHFGNPWVVDAARGPLQEQQRLGRPVGTLGRR